MSLYKRNKTWWYSFSKDGRRFQVSTGSRSKEIATRALARKLTELDEGRNNLPAKRSPVAFQDYATTWMEASRARWSKANTDIQNYNLAHLNPCFGKLLLTRNHGGANRQVPSDSERRTSQQPDNQYGNRNHAHDLEDGETVESY